MSWSYDIPQPAPTVQRPPADANVYPLGTIATSPDGTKWFVVWDNQDKRHYWNTKNEDV